MTEGSKTKKKVKGKKKMLGIEGKKESEIIDNRNSVIEKLASTARSVILKRVYSKSYHNERKRCLKLGMSVEESQDLARKAGQLSSFLWSKEESPKEDESVVE